MLIERCLMNVVDPIKSLDDIRKIKEYLSKKPRNALLFSFGINSGLRISDILALNVEDVKWIRRTSFRRWTSRDNSTHINLWEKIKLHIFALYCTRGSLGVVGKSPCNNLGVTKFSAILCKKTDICAKIRTQISILKNSLY